jgi:hypothetical protein
MSNLHQFINVMEDFELRSAFGSDDGIAPFIGNPVASTGLLENEQPLKTRQRGSAWDRGEHLPSESDVNRCYAKRSGYHQRFIII